MAAISTITNGTNPRLLYNQFITALSGVLGVTDSLQAYIQTAQAQIAVSSHYLDKNGSNDMTFTDVTAGTKTLQNLLGAVVPTVLLGYENNSRPVGVTLTANSVYLMPIRPHKSVTATGIYVRGHTGGGGCILLVGLYDNSGIRVAYSTAPVTVGASVGKEINFDTTVTLTPTTYWAALVPQNTSADQLAGIFRPRIHRVVTGTSFSIPATIATPTTIARSEGPAMYVVLSGGVI